MGVSSIGGSPPPPPQQQPNVLQQQNPVQSALQRKVDDHDGDASDLRIEAKAALTGATSGRLLDVKA